MKKILLLSLFILGSCAHKTVVKVVEVPAAAPEVFTTPKTISEAVNSPFRTEAFKARDKYRHPVETLTFFGLKPDMTVIEIIPANGWYMEILAPFLNDHGHYIMAIPEGPNMDSPNSAIGNWSKKHFQIAKNVGIATFDLTNPKAVLGEPNSVNMVVTFRNVHNWMAKKTEAVAFKSFFKVLKKGGTLGVVEHRAPEDRTDPLAKTGYVRVSDVIKMAKKAGFRLVAQSEINANPKDTKDYEKGVWTLPPTLTLKDQDREKYQAIGESDRMTLKFIKP
ncbi:MAG: class I SAM-dependent methyltransferase [Rhizobacter sp.]|nr:class I SAM-dependent methyltransferase [Bacteriovorax sp.]